MFANRLWLALLYVTAMSAAGALAQVAPDQPDPPDRPDGQEPQVEVRVDRVDAEARQVFEQLEQAYDELDTLRMEGAVITELEIGGDVQRSEHPFTASYQSPNRFRHAFGEELMVGSTGEAYFIYSRPDNAYLMEELDAEQPLLEQLPGPIAQVLQSQNPALLVLLEDDPLRQIRDAGVAVSRGEDVTVDETRYIALEMRGEVGSPIVVMLVDPQTHLIRRLATEIRPQMEEDGVEGVQAARFMIDYTELEVDARFPDEHFAFTPPAGAHDMAEVIEEAQPQPRAQQMIGEEAPGFTLRALDDDEPVQLADLRGKPVVLDFWATWCPPCIEATPHLARLHADRGEEVHIYAINLREDRQRIEQFLQQHELDLPVLLDGEGEVAEQFGIRSIPQTIILDEQGIVRHVYVGYGPDTFARIQRELDALLEEDE